MDIIIINVKNDRSIIYMNLRIRTVIKNGVMVLMTASPALADAATDMMPNLNKGWSGLPENVKKWLMWIIGIAFAIFIVVAIVATFGGAIKAFISGKRNDVHGQSSGMSDAFMGVGAIIVAVIAIMIILFVATNI